MAAAAPMEIASARLMQTGARRFLLAAMLALLCISPFVCIHFLNGRYPSSRNDLIGRWLGTRAALHGQDPYAPAVTREIQQLADHDSTQAFDYPALLVVLFAPFASLSWETFRLLFLFVVVPGLYVGFWLCFPLLHLRCPPACKAALILTGLCSWPVVWGLRTQQPTLLAAVFLLVGCWLLSRERDLSAGILLALATFKPQLAGPFLLWLLLRSLTRRRWLLLAGFCGAEAILLLLAEWLVPGWIPHWLASLREYRSLCGTLPLQLTFGHWTGLLLTMAILLGSAWRVWQLRNVPSSSPGFGYAVAVILAATVCATLTTLPMIYNQVLLWPAALLLFRERPAGQGLPVLAHYAGRFFLWWAFASVIVTAAGELITGFNGFWLFLPMRNHLLGPALTVALLLRPAGAFAASSIWNSSFAEKRRSRLSGVTPGTAHASAVRS